MRLNRLAVTDYRNLSAAVLEPAPQLTVLCGANGQGKTNLLEAVWLLTGALTLPCWRPHLKRETAPRKYG